MYNFGMKYIDKHIKISDLTKMAEENFGNLVKAVVDIDKRIMIVNAQLHSDEESELIKKGSQQQNLWGINLYPKLYGTDDFVEFDSMINLRPSLDNNTRGVEDKSIQDQIIKIVNDLVSK